MSRKTKLTAKAFDRAFDAGEDVMATVDTTKQRRPNRQQRRVNVDFPIWMVESLDAEAGRLGVTRQSIIKVWIAERLSRGAPQAGQ